MIRSVVFTNLLLCGALFAQSAIPASTPDKAKPATAQTKPAAQTQVRPPKPGATPTHYQASRFPGQAGRYYAFVWGIDSLSAKRVESGEMIRFAYRVLDPEKAKALNDKTVEPYLIDREAHVKLVVPEMDKVGKLRQTSTPEEGRVYWVLFSNKGGHVKRGDQVSVVIGNFHADGIGVD